MAGLRCGEVSTIGFAAAYGSVDTWVAIDDDWAMQAMRRLARPGGSDPDIRSNASGAATLGGLLAILHDPALAPVRTHLALGRTSRALIFVTEGVTDPDAFARVLAPA